MGKQLTNQEIFDKALFGIRGQGYKKSAKGETCLYRSMQIDGSTLACAVGHCIPDDVAALWDESVGYDTGINDVYRNHREQFLEFFSEDSLELLSKLQGAHDYYLPSAKRFEENMSEIAESYNLIYTPIGSEE